MIVLLVYRPEADEGPYQSGDQNDYDPFNGIEIYGTYYDAEYEGVVEMAARLAEEHPGHRYHVSKEKIKIGVYSRKERGKR